MATDDTNLGTGGVQARPWARVGYMVLFVIAFGIGQTLLNLTALVQAVHVVARRQPNGFLVEFGRSLAIWNAHVTGYLTCATEDRPFPFSPWPDPHG